MQSCSGRPHSRGVPAAGKEPQSSELAPHIPCFTSPRSPNSIGQGIAMPTPEGEPKQCLLLVQRLGNGICHDSSLCYLTP